MKKGILFFGVFFAALLVGWFVVKTSKIVFLESPFSYKCGAMENQRIALQIETGQIPESQLLETGKDFHASQILANSGEEWLGLYRQGDIYLLQSSKIVVTSDVNRTAVTGRGSGRGIGSGIGSGTGRGIELFDGMQKTRKNIDVKGESKPIFLLKNADYLVQGEIATFLDGYTPLDKINPTQGSVSLKLGIERDFGFGNSIGRLSVESGLDENGQNSLFLIYSLNGKSEVIHVCRRADTNYVGTLYWVGDLDNDQKPDFYFDLYVGERVQNRCLFLSSKAENGHLLRKVANFRISGE